MTTTTNKPEVVAWRWRKPIVNDHGETVGGVWELGGAPAFLPWWTNEPLVRLSDYERLQVAHERLQAECEKLRKDVDKYRPLLETVQGESVAWSGWGCQYPGKMPRLYGDRRIAELNCDWENGDKVLHFTAAPQPAEQQPISHDWDDQDKCRRCGDRDWYASSTCTPKQQPTPNVSALVEALESILHGSLLDDCGNRDDDGISSAISMGIQQDSLQRWRNIARQSLAAYHKGEES